MQKKIDSCQARDLIRSIAQQMEDDWSKSNAGDDVSNLDVDADWLEEKEEAAHQPKAVDLHYQVDILPPKEADLAQNEAITIPEAPK